MNNIEPDYKHFVFELFSNFKSKIELLKDVDKETLDTCEFEGMKLAYSYIMDDIIFLANEFDIDLKDYDLDTYTAQKILAL